MFSSFLLQSTRLLAKSHAVRAADTVCVQPCTEWFKKLSPEGCKETDALRVCSHRASTVEMEDTVNGSIDAYESLFRAGIMCFDIDFIATSDQVLLATHPDDLEVCSLHFHKCLGPDAADTGLGVSARRRGMCSINCSIECPSSR